MNRKEILYKLNAIFKDVFDDQTLSIGEETSTNDIEEWDSLAHITLITTIQNEFNIKFTMQEIISINNVGELADILNEKVK